MQAENTAELKPCPFCGGKAEIKGSAFCWVQCKSCGAETKGTKKRANAIAEWNRRKERQCLRG